MHKYGVRALGVALMAGLCLMGLVAGGAQAESLSDGGKAGKFRVASLSTLVKGTKITGAQEGVGIFLIPSKNAYVECKNGKVTAGEGLGESEVTVTALYEECATFEDTTKNALTSCDVLGEPASTGKIEAKGLGRAKLHGGELYVLFEGSPFATIKFGSECGIGVKVKVEGSMVAKVISGSTEATVHLVEFSEAIQKLFQVLEGKEVIGVKGKYGSAEAFLNSSWNIELTGTHIGKTWSVI